MNSLTNRKNTKNKSSFTTNDSLNNSFSYKQTKAKTGSYTNPQSSNQIEKYYEYIKNSSASHSRKISNNEECINNQLLTSTQTLSQNHINFEDLILLEEKIFQILEV